MNAYAMTNEQITAYGANLRIEERCEATVRKAEGFTDLLQTLNAAREERLL